MTLNNGTRMPLVGFGTFSSISAPYPSYPLFRKSRSGAAFAAPLRLYLIFRYRAAPHNSARSLRQDFCSNSAVPKMEEYCMYFPFSELRKWSKKTAETRRRNCAVLP